MQVQRTVEGIEVSFTRRRYGHRQWFTWVFYRNGTDWLELGDPWPCFSPTNQEILEALQTRPIARDKLTGN